MCRDTIRAMRDQAQRMHALVANLDMAGCKAATRRCGWNGSR